MISRNLSNKKRNHDFNHRKCDVLIKMCFLFFQKPCQYMPVIEVKIAERNSSDEYYINYIGKTEHTN